MLKFSQMTDSTMESADLSGLREALERVQNNDRRFNERLGKGYSSESWECFWEETDADWGTFIEQIKKVLDAIRY